MFCMKIVQRFFSLCSQQQHDSSFVCNKRKRKVITTIDMSTSTPKRLIKNIITDARERVTGRHTRTDSQVWLKGANIGEYANDNGSSDRTAQNEMGDSGSSSGSNMAMGHSSDLVIENSGHIVGSKSIEFDADVTPREISMSPTRENIHNYHVEQSGGSGGSGIGDDKKIAASAASNAAQRESVDTSSGIGLEIDYYHTHRSCELDQVTSSSGGGGMPTTLGKILAKVSMPHTDRTLSHRLHDMWIATMQSIFLKIHLIAFLSNAIIAGLYFVLFIVLSSWQIAQHFAHWYIPVVLVGMTILHLLLAAVFLGTFVMRFRNERRRDTLFRGAMMDNSLFIDL